MRTNLTFSITTSSHLYSVTWNVGSVRIESCFTPNDVRHNGVGRASSNTTSSQALARPTLRPSRPWRMFRVCGGCPYVVAEEVHDNTTTSGDPLQRSIGAAIREPFYTSIPDHPFWTYEPTNRSWYCSRENRACIHHSREHSFKSTLAS